MYRIGVDVGGTNTDCAILDVSQLESPHRGVVTTRKRPTTPDITSGIQSAVEDALKESQIDKSNVSSVAIGTTHFVNAVTEADPRRLRRVAVIRLCGPATRVVAPFSTFPAAIRGVVEGPSYYLDGGLEIDGREILPLDVEQIEEAGRNIQQRGINTIAIVGVFAPLDHAEEGSQEERCKEILLRVNAEFEVVCSRSIGGVGLLERENATILNAAILATARTTIYGFVNAMSELGLRCPLYITQNDGTLTSAERALRTPIKTFASGPTNSATGAAFLAGYDRAGVGKPEQLLVVDIGGTTTDICALLPSGFPRQAPGFVEVGGVRTAFSMPDVYSVGLGGGSIVQVQADGSVKVGPASVGHELLRKAQVFGGGTLTATDIVVAEGKAVLGANAKLDIPKQVISSAREKIKTILQRAVESMKVSASPATILLVGGGSIVYMDDVEGVAKCIVPPHHDSANAVGAAIAKVAGEVDLIEIMEGQDEAVVVKRAKEAAIHKAIENGAEPDEVQIAEVEKLPLQYVTNKATRIKVKAVGRLRPQLGRDEVQLENKMEEQQNFQADSREKIAAYKGGNAQEDTDPSSYRPKVVNNEWILSETDIKFIACGTGILGTGGGGSSYISYLMSLDALRKGGEGSMRVISPESLQDDDIICLGSWYGAPSVSGERLPSGTEIPQGIDAVNKVLGIKDFHALLTLEIGGGNGLATFPTSVHYGRPTVDGDMMGRAYPSGEHALAYVYGEKVTPCAMADIKGNVSVVVHAESSQRLEKMMRATCIELGLSTSAVAAPLRGSAIKTFAIPNTISQAWFLGRAVHTARQTKTSIVKSIFDLVPGKLLFSGKIVDVSRDVSKGYTIGKCLIAPLSQDEIESGANIEHHHLLIPFQNEFLYAGYTDEAGKEVSEILCSVPDLITILGEDGEGIGSQDLRYGLRVTVIAMPAHPLWTEDEKAMKIGGPEYFGFDMKWKSIGKYTPLKSVIDEYQEEA